MVWDLETLKRLNSEEDEKAKKRYVVVCADEWTSDDYKPKFLKNLDTRGGFVEPVFTDYLQIATLFSREGVEQIFKSLPKYHSWEIWSVKGGIILDELVKSNDGD